MDVRTTLTEFRRGRSGFAGIDYYRELMKDPLWYTRIHRMSVARKLGTASVAITAGQLTENPLRRAKTNLFAMYQYLLDHDEIALGKPGQGLYEFDRERDPVLDTFVIHHSHRAKGITPSELSTLHLFRLYVPTFQAPESEEDKKRLKDQPIYSGHFWNGRQHFCGYHWLIEQDGRAIRLLEDHEIGWQAGNWDVNKRSIAICFNGDYSHEAPNEKMLATARELIHEQYSWMHPSAENITGHFNHFDTKCPGDQFVRGVHWKDRLL